MIKKTKIPTIAAMIVATTFLLSNQAYSQNRPQGRQQEPPSFSKLLSQMDTNKDGMLSKKEVKGPLKRDFSKIDTDQNGFITKEEFDKAPKPKRGGQRPPRN
jgi:Ca2+-binding EF-hand superfamily protein